MEKHELEIEIGKDGKVRVHVKGAKGPACLDYARLLEGIVGRALSSELTQEYYEPDARVATQHEVHDHERRGQP